MNEKRKHSGYWNYERCINESNKYKTKTEFQKYSYGAYKAAKKNGWLIEIFSNMVEIIKPRNYWNHENSKKEALKYKTKTELRKCSYGAYKYLFDNKLLNSDCSHMKEIKKPNGYWNYENCYIEALKYESKKDFIKKSVSSYNSARKNKWLDEICIHMKPLGNLKNRYIYVFEFSDNYAYVGLTCNLERRKLEHLGLNGNKFKKTAVLKHIEESTLLPKFKILTIGSITEKEAISKEEYFVIEYKKNGWMLLNKAKTGGLGSKNIWYKDRCKCEALKYKTKKEFIEKCGGAYNSARKNGWIDEITSHMIVGRKAKGYWNFENCYNEALKYRIKEDFKKNSSGAYNSARKNMWLDLIFSK